jgi:PhnB protein
MPVRPIPPGYHTITPYLVVKGANELIEFLKKAFDAKVKSIHYKGDNIISNAELQIGDSMIMLGEVMETYQPMPMMLYLYVENTDSLFKKAVEAGGISIMEPMDMFYGDRSGAVKDKWDNQWWIATHIEDVSPDELERRQEEQIKMQEKVK